MLKFRPDWHGRFHPHRGPVPAIPIARGARAGISLMFAAATLVNCAASSPSLVGAWNRAGTGHNAGDWRRVVFSGGTVTIASKQADNCRFVGEIMKNTLRNVCTPQPDTQSRQTWENLHDGTIRMTDTHGVANIMKYDIKGDRLNLTGTAGGFDGDTSVFDRKSS